VIEGAKQREVGLAFQPKGKIARELSKKEFQNISGSVLETRHNSPPHAWGGGGGNTEIELEGDLNDGQEDRLEKEVGGEREGNSSHAEKWSL